MKLTHLICEKCGLDVWVRPEHVRPDDFKEYGDGLTIADRPGRRGDGELLTCPSHEMGMTYFLRAVSDEQEGWAELLNPRPGYTRHSITLSYLMPDLIGYQTYTTTVELRDDQPATDVFDMAVGRLTEKYPQAEIRYGEEP